MLYKITLFILGVPPTKSNVRVVYEEADTMEDAEYNATHGLAGEGWGVYKTSQMDLDYPDFTKEQVDTIQDLVYGIINRVIPDHNDCETVVDAILNAVIDDIVDTADWSDLDALDDEVHTGDVEIAVARVLYNRLTVESYI